MNFLKERLSFLCLSTVLCAPVALLPAEQAIAADSYPSHPIRLIVPTPPGGNLDLTARLLAKYMEKPLGQPLIVENHTGGDGIIAMHDLQRASPDGYTLGIVSGGPLLAQPVLRKDAGYTFKDFTPVGVISVTPMVFVVPAKSPFKTLNDFVNYARQHPGELSFGSAGVGGSNHIGFEMFKQIADIDVVHIPYRGSAPVMQDLIGGHLAISLEQLTGVSGNIKGNLLRPLAVSVSTRVSALPSVPTVQELGFKGYDESTWLGLAAPVSVPPQIAEKLQGILQQVRENPDFVKQLADMGAMPQNISGQAFGAFLQSEDNKLRIIAGRLGLIGSVTAD